MLTVCSLPDILGSPKAFPARAKGETAAILAVVVVVGLMQGRGPADENRITEVNPSENHSTRYALKYDTRVHRDSHSHLNLINSNRVAASNVSIAQHHYTYPSPPSI